SSPTRRSSDLLCALQMKIVACSFTRHKMRRRRSLGKTAHAPRFAPVVTIIQLFILSRDRFVRLNRGTVFNLLSSQIHEQAVGVLTQVSESMGRNQHQAAR